MVKRPDARTIVLTRRAKFVSAALAGTLACGKTTAPADDHTPRVCLSAAPVGWVFDEAGTRIDEAGTRVPPPWDPSVGTPPPPDPVAPPVPVTVGDGSAPRPCLSPPRPCLSIAAPKTACDPPYTIGPDGKKRYKPECL